MTMIKGAKTIGEFKIRMFIARHFAEGRFVISKSISQKGTNLEWI